MHIKTAAMGTVVLFIDIPLCKANGVNR